MGSSSMDYDNMTLPNNGYNNVVKRYVINAFCHSEKCNDTYQNGIVKTKNIKNVKKFVTECPDCGHILVWERQEIV